MPSAPDAGAFAAVNDLLAGWKMSFQSVHFLLFLPVVVGATFVLPKRLRKAWLLVASYYFYFFAAPSYLVLLLGLTLFSFAALQGLGAAKTRGGKNAWLGIGLGVLLLNLVFFKYNGFFASFLTPFFENFGIEYAGGAFTTAKAVGISFTTLMAVGCLIDTWRGDIAPEKNLLTHALFLGFFPAVVSGPISRAGDLKPQLEDTGRRFDPQNAAVALRRMALGFFKKLAIADTLAVFVFYVYGPNLADYSGPTLFFATVGFALQLYFDFSGYTDIALGAAMLLGIRLPENFNTPYFSTNFSSFWARWHMSLSSFLQDYVFTPLVWSRWTEKLPFIGKGIKGPPVLSSLAIVFLVSGVWHGDTLCFVVWGALQAAYRIGEELLHRRLGKPKKNPSLGVRIGKTAAVCLLWVESMVFFAAGFKGIPVGQAFSAFLRQFTFGGPGLFTTLFDSAYYTVYNLSLVAWAFLAFTAVCLVAGLWADWFQFAKLGGKNLALGMGQVRPARRWLLYYGIALCCLAGFLLQSGGFGGSNFIYGGF